MVEGREVGWCSLVRQQAGIKKRGVNIDRMLGPAQSSSILIGGSSMPSSRRILPLAKAYCAGSSVRHYQ